MNSKPFVSTAARNRSGNPYPVGADLSDQFLRLPQHPEHAANLFALRELGNLIPV